MRDGSAASIRLFMCQPTAAAILSTVSGNGTSWIIGGSSDENLALDSVTHYDMAARLKPRVRLPSVFAMRLVTRCCPRAKATPRAAPW